MTEEQEQIYQHAITSLIEKVDKRDALIEALRREIRRLEAAVKEGECNGRSIRDNH